MRIPSLQKRRIALSCRCDDILDVPITFIGRHLGHLSVCTWTFKCYVRGVQRGSFKENLELRKLMKDLNQT